MHTFVAHAVGRTRLFHDWGEAAALWSRITTGVPGVRALVLMPDHLHLDQTSPDGAALGRALRSFARWRNAHRGEAGPVFRRRPAPRALAGRQHVRRNLRYIHLNPCRAGLVRCPLAWPFSTHRDALGLTLSPARERVGEPERFHAYVSADPTCGVVGTALPAHPAGGETSLDAVAGAVSELLRVPLPWLCRRGAPRRVFISVARAVTSASTREIAAFAGLDGSGAGVARVPAASPTVARLVSRVAADPRFPGLVERDPRLSPGRR
jgi:hypothetical protein